MYIFSEFFRTDIFLFCFFKILSHLIQTVSIDIITSTDKHHNNNIWVIVDNTFVPLFKSKLWILTYSYTHIHKHKHTNIETYLHISYHSKMVLNDSIFVLSFFYVIMSSSAEKRRRSRWRWRRHCMLFYHLIIIIFLIIVRMLNYNRHNRNRFVFHSFRIKGINNYMFRAFDFGPTIRTTLAIGFLQIIKF